MRALEGTTKTTPWDGWEIAADSLQVGRPMLGKEEERRVSIRPS